MKKTILIIATGILIILLTGVCTITPLNAVTTNVRTDLWTLDQRFGDIGLGLEVYDLSDDVHPYINQKIEGSSLGCPIMMKANVIPNAILTDIDISMSFGDSLLNAMLNLLGMMTPIADPITTYDTTDSVTDLNLTSATLKLNGIVGFMTLPTISELVFRLITEDNFTLTENNNTFALWIDVDGDILTGYPKDAYGFDWGINYTCTYDATHTLLSEELNLTDFRTYPTIETEIRNATFDNFTHTCDADAYYNGSLFKFMLEDIYGNPLSADDTINVMFETYVNGTKKDDIQLVTYILNPTYDSMTFLRMTQLFPTYSNMVSEHIAFTISKDTSFEQRDKHPEDLYLSFNSLMMILNTDPSIANGIVLDTEITANFTDLLSLLTNSMVIIYVWDFYSDHQNATYATFATLTELFAMMDMPIFFIVDNYTAGQSRTVVDLDLEELWNENMNLSVNPYPDTIALLTTIFATVALDVPLGEQMWNEDLGTIEMPTDFGSIDFPNWSTFIPVDYADLITYLLGNALINGTKLSYTLESFTMYGYYSVDIPVLNLVPFVASVVGLIVAIAVAGAGITIILYYRKEKVV